MSLIGQTPTLNPLAPPAPPTMQTVDQQGQSQAPQGNDAGMATLANPTQPISGGASMADMLSAKGQSLPTVSSPSLSKLDAGMNQATQAQAASGAPPQPGDWARTLVAGAQSMMGNAAGAVKGIGASLGDAAAVGTVPRGGGALTGINRTLGARSERERQGRLDQQAATKDQMLMAEANARMIHEQKLTHQLDESVIQQSVDSGNQVVAKLKTAASPAPIIAEGLTSDQLTQYLKDNKIDPTKETAYPTGRKQIGENKDGSPMYRTTYTAMGVPPDVKLDPSVDKDKELLDDMNRYSPPASGGKWGTGGVQNMSGTQFNMVMQQVAEGKVAGAARDKTLADMKLQKESTDFKNSPPEWVNALSQAPGHDPIAARNAILSDPALAAKFPNLDHDLQEKYGEKNFNTMLDDYQKRQDAKVDFLTETNKELAKADGQHAAEIGADINAAIKDPKNAGIVPQLMDMKKRADAKAQASLDFEQKKKQVDQKVQDAISSEDLPVLVEAANNYQLDPNKLFSMRKNLNSQFKAEMLRKDPTWSESLYKQRYATAQEFLPEAKGGLQVQSLQTFADHLSAAENMVDKIKVGTGSKWFNTAINKIVPDATGWNAAEITAYKYRLQAAKSEYLNFLDNGHVPHEAQEREVANNLTEDTSPKAAEAAMKTMAETIAYRARNLNRGYKRVMKQDIPDLIDGDTKAALNKFGISDQFVLGNQSEQGTQAETNRLAGPKAPGAAPKGAASPTPGKSADGIPVWKMNDGTIQDASGKRYNPQTGKPQ